MTDSWIKLPASNGYASAGPAQALDIDLDAAITEDQKPVMALLYDRDNFAPQSASSAVTKKFTAAALTEQLISSQELGRKADHYAWARQGGIAADAIQQWLHAAKL